uniref:Uncharacterized protein n=1 Tax=Leptobrachium leishanense TaxID=445787 RepID=A0A8C5Q3C7_9ANUR
MSGKAISAWWTSMRPYAIAYKDLWVGVGIMGFLYYKLSYGGKDAPLHSLDNSASAR